MRVRERTWRGQATRVMVNSIMGAEYKLNWLRGLKRVGGVPVCERLASSGYECWEVRVMLQGFTVERLRNSEFTWLFAV